MRVYEFAKKIGVESKAVLEKLQKMGYDVKSHLSPLTSEQLQALQGKKNKDSEITTTKAENMIVKNSVTKNKNTAKKNNSNSRPSFSKRPGSSVSSGFGARSKKQSDSLKLLELTRENLEGKALDLKSFSYQVVDLASSVSVNPVQVIKYFLGQGKFYSLNHVLTESEVKQFAEEFGLNLIFPKPVKQETIARNAQTGDLRDPIVAIMGHVDHGKTTLIDFIRKTKLADKEAGGITQKVSVYDVKTSRGNVMLIDTPGHEAFSTIRGRGSKITDIAVIIIAADDGVMPQTIESIKMAKNMGATIVVAINKMDKEGVEANLDRIKQELSQHEILLEEWGGDTVAVPISAKTGKGVSELLEMIHLQAEMLDLKANKESNAEAFILESFLDKGLGPVAQIIVKNGTLKKGDHFLTSQNQAGKVKALFDTYNKSVSKIEPSRGGKVVGLSKVATPGETLKVVSISEAKDAQSAVMLSPAKEAKSVSADSEKSINLVIKADSYGTLEAMLHSISLLPKKDKKLADSINIVASSVGNIFEKDVMTASESSARIIGMNVSVDRGAEIKAKVDKVEIKTNNIIYRLVEDVEHWAIEHLKSIKQLREVGTAKVTKVFDMRNRGVVAGCVVKEGFFIAEGVVACFRNGQKVGQSKITSLQQERSIKDKVEAGSECGFICEKFKDWQVGDQAVCYVEERCYQD